MKISQHKYFKHLKMVQVSITNATPNDFSSFLSKCESVVGKTTLKRHITEGDVNLQEYVRDNFTISYLKNQGQIVAQYVGDDSTFFEKLGIGYPNGSEDRKKQLEQKLFILCSSMTSEQIDEFWYSCEWVEEGRNTNKSLPQNVIDQMINDKEYLKNRIRTLIQETDSSFIENLLK